MIAGANDDPIERSVEKFFFSDIYYNSPLLVLDTFPDVTNAASEAYYNPLIDAFYIPGYEEITDVESKLMQRFRTHLLLEQGHRLLTSTSIMCQMRVIAGLLYDLLLRLADPPSVKTEPISETEFVVRFQALQQVLNIYVHQTKVVQEAFALIATVGQLRLRRPSHRYQDAEFIESRCLRLLSTKPGFRQIREAYEILRGVESRFFRPSFVTRLIAGALTIDWPSSLKKRPFEPFELDPQALRSEILRLFSSKEMQPLARLYSLSEELRRYPLVGSWSMPLEEFNDSIVELVPSLARQLKGQCEEHCMCLSLQSELAKDDDWPVKNFGLAASIATNDILKSHVEGSAGFLDVPKRTYVDGESDASARQHYMSHSPNWLFCGKIGLLKTEVMERGGIEVHVLLASLESLRQQVREILASNNTNCTHLCSPWSHIQLGVYHDEPDWLGVDIGKKFNLFDRFRASVAGFSFAKRRI